VPIGGRQLRVLLTLLALEAGRVVPAGTLADRVWPQEQPADPGNALQTLVSRLRAALRGAGCDRLIESHPAGYRLTVPPDAVDALAFRSLAADGRRALAGGDAAAAVRVLRPALALWRGQPLADAEGCEFAEAAAIRLAELRDDAVLDRIEAELALGQGASLVGELKAVVSADPLAERPLGLLMRALYAGGRQAEALAAYAQARERFAEQLGVDPSPAVEQVYLRILRGEEPFSQRSSAPPPDPLTPPALSAPVTSFVGREDEMSLLLKLLGSARLVTLTGPGGMGKTRLAAEVPRRLDAPAWFVPLASVTDPGEVPYAVLDELGIRERIFSPRTSDPGAADPVSRLATALAGRDDVLILDNCEHVIDAAAELAARVLAACPRIRIVATSREPLRTDGEVLCPVPPLSFPPPGGEPATAASYPSVRLLCDRAAAVQPGFGLDPGNAGAVVRICRALDGMPLAIELAAVWLRVLSPAQLAERLDDRFALLTGGSRTALPRHQTLRAVVDWSWELLSERERVLARRLSVFPAGATLAAAERVCAGEDLPAAEVLTGLSGLVGKSFLMVADGPRYQMLETVRAYCLDRLSGAGETRHVRDAFAAYYLELAQTADPGLRGPEQNRWTHELSAEQDNLHAAVRWTISQRDAVTALLFVRALGWYWMLRGMQGDSEQLSVETLAIVPAEAGTFVPAEAGTFAVAEGRVICALAAAGPAWDMDAMRPALAGAVANLTAWPEYPAVVHPLAAMGEPMLALCDREPRRALAVFDRFETSQDAWLRAVAPFFRASFATLIGGSPEQAERDCRRALIMFRDLKDAWGQTGALVQLAQFAQLRGDHQAALVALTEASAFAGQLDALSDRAHIEGQLAMIRMRTGDLAGARADLDRAVRMDAHYGAGRTDAVAWLGLVAADLAWLEGDTAAAARQCDDVLGLLRDKPTHWWSGHRALVQTRLAMIALGEGDEARCRELLADSLRVAASWVERGAVAAVIDGIAVLAGAAEDWPAAATLLGAAHSVRGAFDESSLDAPAVRESARRALGASGFDAAYQRGRDVGYEDAQELASAHVLRR
jgi:predicted ATPase/DNA-binding SARP family transcriptional activator